MSPEEIQIRKKVIEEIRTLTKEWSKRIPDYHSDAENHYHEGKIDGCEAVADFLEGNLPS